MRRRLRHSIGTLLLVGWCLLFLRCETTEKSMVRALYLAQNEATVTVGLLYQAPEASADASEASAAMQMPAGRRKYAGKGAFVRAKKAAAEGRLPPV